MCLCERECILTHILYPLLVIEDLFEPAEVLLLKRHQDHKRAGFVVQCRVVRGRLRVEEPHGGLVPHVLLIASHWGIIQPEAGRGHKTFQVCLIFTVIFIFAIIHPEIGIYF